MRSTPQCPPYLASSGDSAIRWKVLSAIIISIPFSLLVLSMISLQREKHEKQIRNKEFLTIGEKRNFTKLMTELDIYLNLMWPPEGAKLLSPAERGQKGCWPSQGYKFPSLL